jgi:hypothetical protein
MYKSVTWTLSLEAKKGHCDTIFYSTRGILSLAIEFAHLLAVELIVSPVDDIYSEEELTLFNLYFEDQVYI